ncbi:MAG: helix-turn-helix transcriptional regulator [Bacteroidota bacterium]
MMRGESNSQITNKQDNTKDEAFFLSSFSLFWQASAHKKLGEQLKKTYLVDKKFLWMYYRIIPPPEQLSHLVKSFWVVEGGEKSAHRQMYRLMADSCIEMVFQYRNSFVEIGSGQTIGRHPLATISGPSRSYKELFVSGSYGMIGVCLYPSAAEQVWNIPSAELKDKMIATEDLLQQEAHRLEDQILAAQNLGERYLLLVNYLSDRLARNCPPDRRLSAAIRRIYETGGQLSIAKISEEIALSNRQLERMFLSNIGMRPKLFSRIVRFQSSFQQSAARHSTSLTDLAYRCGYADQAHFSREFKEFAGMNPSQYFRLTEEVADSFAQIP